MQWVGTYVIEVLKPGISLKPTSKTKHICVFDMPMLRL